MWTWAGVRECHAPAKKPGSVHVEASAGAVSDAAPSDACIARDRAKVDSRVRGECKARGKSGAHEYIGRHIDGEIEFISPLCDRHGAEIARAVLSGHCRRSTGSASKERQRAKRRSICQLDQARTN